MSRYSCSPSKPDYTLRDRLEHERRALGLRTVVRDRLTTNANIVCCMGTMHGSLISPTTFIAVRHRGMTSADNLAWTCAVCNRHKGSDVASVDSVSHRVTRLFHPRRDKWNRHFQLQKGWIIPQSAVRRVTEFLLQLNRPDRVSVRTILFAKGLYPR